MLFAINVLNLSYTCLLPALCLSKLAGAQLGPQGFIYT